MGRFIGNSVRAWWQPVEPDEVAKPVDDLRTAAGPRFGAKRTVVLAGLGNTVTFLMPRH